MAIKKGVSKQSIYYDEQKESGNVDSIKNNNDTNVSIDYQNSNVETMEFDSEHVVESGETLTSIAEQYGLTYQELADYNNIADPNYIENGQVIKIPNLPEDTSTYTVKEGDNLTIIAEKYGVSIDDLVKENNISNPNYIEVDQIIKIPSKGEKTDKKEELSKQIADQLKMASQNVNDVVDSIIPTLVKQIQNINDKNNSTAEDLKKLVIDKLNEIDANFDPESINIIVDKVLAKNNETDSKAKAKQLAEQIKIASQKANDAIKSAIPLLTKQIQDINNQNSQTAIDLGKMINDKLKEQNIKINSKSIKEMVDKILTTKEEENPVNQAQQLVDQIKNISQKANNTVDSIILTLAKQAQEIKDKNINNAYDLKKIITEKLKESNISINYQNINNIIESFNFNNFQTNYQQLINQIKMVSQKVNNTMESMIPVLAKQIQDFKESNNKVVNNLKEIISNKLKEQNININPEKILNFINLIMTNKSNNKPTFEDYTVQRGQTLSAIAAKYGLSVDDIVKANNITDPNNINVGQVLKIPQNNSSSNSEPTSVKSNRKVVKKIDLSKILKNSNIGNAIVKYAEEIQKAFKVKIDENEFITIRDVEVDGNPCYLTHIVIDDPSKIKGEPANGKYASGLEKPSSAAKRKNATLVINGSNFLDNGEQDLRNTNHIAIVNGKIVHDGTSQAMEICLDKDGRLFTPSPGTTATDLIDKGVVYTFASLDSRLIWNGEKDYISQPSSENDTAYNSTVIGMTKPGEYYILTGSTTNVGAREYLYNKGCTYAKSMDQGGSVSLVFDGELINNPTDETGERSVGDFLYFT